MPPAAAPEKVDDEGDDDQPEEDAGTAVTEEEMENVGEYKGASDVTQKGVGAATATAEEPAASKAAVPAEVERGKAGAGGGHGLSDHVRRTS
jgi:hypothetical protein